MYEERLKPGINPLWSILGWAVCLYILYIIGGIFRILLKYDKPYITQISLFAATVLFAWYFVSKFLTEFEISISSRYITVTRFLSHKTNQVRTIRSSNIVLLTDDIEKTKKHHISKTENYIRAFQKGNPVYIISNENGKYLLTKFRFSGIDAAEIEKKLKKEGF